MEQEQRLAPVPRTGELRTAAPEYQQSYLPMYDDPVSEGRRNLQHYLGVVRKRLPLILALMAIVTSAAAFYMYRQPDQFEAVSKMVIEPRRPKVTSKDAININFGGDANYMATQIQLLQGQDLKKELVRELGLYRDPNLSGGSGGGFFSNLSSVFSGSEPKAEKQNSLAVLSEVPVSEDTKPVLSPEEEARVVQYAGLFIVSAATLERTNLVDVRVRSSNKELAQVVANKLPEVFIRQHAQREMEGAIRAKEDLEKSMEDLSRTIAEQELELIAAMRESNLPLQEKGQDLAASRLGTLSETYLKTMETRRQLESRYNAAVSASQRGEGMNIPDLYENKIFQDTMRLNNERKAKLQDDIRNIDKQIQQAETEKSELLVRYTPEYPEVKKMEERIASLKESRTRTEQEVSSIIDRDQKKIEREAVGGALTALRAQLEAKRKEEGQAQAAYDREAALANIQGQAQTRLTTLKRDIETKRNLLDTYTQRLKEQELAIANSTPDNIKMAAAAETAPRVGPNRTRNIIVALLLSLAAGVGLAFLLDYLDDSVKNSEEIGRQLGLPTLALIPHYFGSEKKRLRLAAESGGSPGTSLVALEERHSPMAEAYRHLRTSLLFSSAGKPPQSILVTSSQPSEGKTTTAINTAITLAQADVDVVIVDCDLRRPRIHNYFDLENSEGLTNYLSGDRNTKNLIKACRDLPRLKVITSGPIPPNPAELLSSNEMRNLLQFLRSKYKHVIIDSPPAISFTDAAILSTQVDGVILVAMAGKSSMHLMRRFKQRLGNIGARIYGVVLNGIKQGSVEYGYYGSGYYDYYKSADADTTTPRMDQDANGNGSNGRA